MSVKNPFFFFLNTWVLGVGLLISSCSPKTFTTYRSLHEVRESKAVEEGWIPDFIPESAMSIYEEHNPQTGIGGGGFLFGKEDGNPIQAKLGEPLDLRDVPEEVHNDPDFRTKHLTFYRYQDFIIGVHWNNRTIRFWKSPENSGVR